MIPSANASSSITVASMVTCCSLPRGSVKRRSTYLMSLSLMVFRTSEALLIFPSSLIARGRWEDCSVGGGAAEWSDGVQSALAGADADGLFDGRDEDFSVADAAGLGGVADRLDGAVHQLVRQHDLDLHLRQEIHDIFGAAIELGVSLLAPKPLGLGDGNALQPDFLQRLLHFI